MMARLVRLLLLFLLTSFCYAKVEEEAFERVIEEVSRRKLEELIEKEEFLSVFFYTKKCPECDQVLEELEKINEEAESFGIKLVKNSERVTAKKYGGSSLPALVYFRNQEPTVYDGDLLDEGNVLAWLTDIDSLELPDAIEEVNAKILKNIIDDSDYVAVLFTKDNCKECENVLRELENIDDEADSHGIGFVKINDKNFASELGIKDLPALMYYQNKVPTLYTGDLQNEEKILRWLIRLKKGLQESVIEDVTIDMLNDLIEKEPFLAVLVYDRNSEKSKATLEELEKIDEDSDIPIVKINDDKLADKYGLDSLPALIYFEKQIPNFYQGDLLEEKEVLNWLMQQKESDEIEDVTDKVLEQMIETSECVAVLFYNAKSKESKKVLEELEAIDDEADHNGIPFVKIDDNQLAAKYGISKVPVLVYFENKFPNIYQGDLTIEEDVLKWLIDQKSSDEIEDISDKILDDMIKTSKYLVVLFYDKDDKKCLDVIKELENIDDEADKKGLPFVRIDDDKVAKQFGILDELPALVYFEKQIPSIYQGDLTDEEEVLKWLIEQMTSDEIEEVTNEMLDILIENNEYFAVLFYDSSSSENMRIVKELENIDDDADKNGIAFVKTDDREAATRYGLEILPALVFFEKKLPNIYEGDLSSEDDVLNWLLDQQTSEEIADVTEEMLLQLIETSPYLAVLFYTKQSPVSEAVLKELENIDDEAEEYEIPFVKIDDESLAQSYGLYDELPIIVYFENKLPTVYEGNLKDEGAVLDWLVQQKEADSIEEVTEEILKDLITKKDYVLVFFAPENCRNCETILEELEKIDDETDEYGIFFVTTDDLKLAKKTTGLNRFPALVLFRKEEPIIFRGDLKDEDSILQWVTSEETMRLPDEIDDVNFKRLDKLLNTSEYVAVLFIKPKCAECELALKEIENIDEMADELGIDLVKCSDQKAAKEYHILTFPSLVFFRGKFLQFYEGDLHEEENVLLWLRENKEKEANEIEYVDRKMLEMLLEETEGLAVFFYDEDCVDCEKIINELENIDDETDEYGIHFVKTDDIDIARELAVTEIPSLVYFENNFPSIYSGDIQQEEEVLQWLILQKTEDTIENINRELLFRMIDEQEYLVVYFYIENDAESREILKHLELIDDDCSEYEVQLVKMNDNLMAKKYGIRNPPGISYFRRGKNIKYPGDLFDEEEILEWITNPENMELSDGIEKLNRRMFERLIYRTEYLAVLFYSKGCNKCDKVLEELEKIDDEADEAGIKFVKIEDVKMANKYGVYAIPGIVIFKGGDKDYTIYAGDMKQGERILEWLMIQKNPSNEYIEDVHGEVLQNLIDNSDYLAVYFYTSDCVECKRTLEELENIDDDTDRHGILFVKTQDIQIATDYGVNDFPALIYFENQIPSFYEGSLLAEEELLQWLIHQKTEDTIETVNRNLLDFLIHEEQYVAVLFFKPHCKACEIVLQELENIDDDTDQFGIHIVKTQDSGVAKRYGLRTFPSLVYFRNGNALVFDGDLKNEEAVLEWLIDDDNRELADEIEAINARMLDRLIEESPFLAVIFYEDNCDECLEILQELEDIDDEADLFGIDFVKVNDPAASSKWNILHHPSLIYFRKTEPVLYEGDLSNSERVLKWLTSQDMIEVKDEIEEVNRRMLDKLLEENDFVSVFFYDENCPKCDGVLQGLESIDDEVSELDIMFVKVKDARYARRYGIRQIPALSYFRRKFPSIFRGDLMDEKLVLEWLRKHRYRNPELNLFMYTIIAISIAFILYTLFLMFCFKPGRDK